MFRKNIELWKSNKERSRLSWSGRKLQWGFVAELWYSMNINRLISTVSSYYITTSNVPLLMSLKGFWNLILWLIFLKLTIRPKKSLLQPEKVLASWAYWMKQILNQLKGIGGSVCKTEATQKDMQIEVSNARWDSHKEDKWVQTFIELLWSNNTPIIK